MFSLIKPQVARLSRNVQADPVKRLFIDKLREFKGSTKGLEEEVVRLRRLYKIEDDKATIESSFAPTCEVSLHDLDNREIAIKAPDEKIERSALLESIPEQVTHDLHLPVLNKPDPNIILENPGVPRPVKLLNEARPDYEFQGDKMTPEILQRDMRVYFGPDMPTIHDDKSPQRDVVNFPRATISETTPPARYHFIPESWFRFFHPKTGVTGPYVFGGAFTTFLLSKEWLVWEHELLTGVTSTAIFAYAVIKFGPKVSAYISGKTKEEVDNWDKWRHGNIATLEEIQTHYRNELQKTDLVNQIYEIRKQDVDLQLEAEHRRRFKTVFDDTRRRLNYLVAVANAKREVAHKNLVNWVVTNAATAFGPKEENEVLDHCIVDLKKLASQNVGAI